MPADPLDELQQRILSCRKCPRLVAWRERVACQKRAAFQDEEYWGRPVPGFGDPAARLLVIGLAPAAHGGNRTGRVFTGDRSGDFLFRALYENGFANQPESVSRDDGLALSGAYVTATVRCAPPDNKPARDEILNCRSYSLRELALLKNVRVVVALGGIALNGYLSVLQDTGHIRSRARFPFAHGALYETHAGGPMVLASYHPSQQNTSTRRLTIEMLREIFATARRLTEKPATAGS